jgi:hypothetical protein
MNKITELTCPANERKKRTIEYAKKRVSAIYRTERNWQQWEGGERRMDAALWELFRLKAAVRLAK